MRPSFAAGVLIAAIAIPTGFNSPASGHESRSGSYPHVHRAPSAPAVLAWLFGDPRRSGPEAREGATRGPDAAR